MNTLTEGWLRSDVERRFGLRLASAEKASLAIGAEIELLPQFLDTHLPVPIRSGEAAGSVEVVRRVARAGSWGETVEGDDPPSWTLASGARVSFEPGGQIELSSARHATASSLIAELRSIVTLLSDEFERSGIILEGRGVDPHNDWDAIGLQLHRPRYATMTRYFESLNPSGVRMMRQTASVQVNVQSGTDPLTRWNLLNALAPYLVAIFSNSSKHAGRDTGHQSYRAHLWRTLDGTRTGRAQMDGDAVAHYLRFAMEARAMFSTPHDDQYFSFREWLCDGHPTRPDWDLHLSTLFPEIRPKGFFEIRSPDMVDPRWIAAPIALVAGIVYDQPSADRARELLSEPDDSRLVRAGRDGLHDEGIAAMAKELASMAIAGCESLGARYISLEDVYTLREFTERYTLCGRSPADEP